MFYVKGIDITNDKQMFNFLKDHYTYYTMNSWNGLKSIANNVKVHKLGLDGNCYTALAFLQDDDYFTINMMIEDWEAEHKGYKVGFNGRSGGYLVLYNDHNNCSALPDEIDECEDYEEYKRWCKDYCGSVKENRRDLVETVRLVQDFDKLCDELRDYVNELSTRDFVSETFEKVVNQFNEDYYDDLEHLGFGELIIEDEKVFIGEIKQMTSLYEAFRRLANRRDFGLRLKEVEPDYVMLVEE